MKKIILFLSLIALSITSCTSDDETKTTDTASIEKTSVSLSVDGTSQTAKQVNRGTIFAWVQNINVTATASLWGYSKSEEFELTGTGGATGVFKIEDVAVGLNNFVATTTTNTAPTYAFALVTTGTASALKTALVAHNPYATYNATTNATIQNNTINSVNFDMTTQHGRLISVFEFENDAVLRANTDAIVTATVAGKTVLTSAKLADNKLVSFEWSDNDATVGKTVVFTVNVYQKGTTNIVKTFTISPTPIKASTSTNCIYQINKDGIFNSASDTLVFSWQAWNNEDCETNYDNNGYNCIGRDVNGHNREGYDKCGYQKTTGNYNANQDEDLSDGANHAKCQ